MKYALNLSEDFKVLSATYLQYADKNAEIVDELPEGDITHYKYLGGEFIKLSDNEINVDVEPTVESPSQLDIIEAQVTYTAMMTGTLLEV